MRHFTSTHQIDLLDRESARGRCYYAVLTQEGLDHWGVYTDRYRVIAEGWRFESRKVSVDGCVPGGFADHQLGRST